MPNCKWCGKDLEASPEEIKQAEDEYRQAYENALGEDPGELLLLCKECAVKYDKSLAAEVLEELGIGDTDGHHTPSKTIH